MILSIKKARIVLAVILVLVGLSVFYVNSLNRANKRLKLEIENLKKDPQLVSNEEVKQLVEKISKLVVLPSDEEPVVATVTDKEKLKDQPVFAKTENGDKILIYSNAKKAYVYRPSNNIIVDVIPVNIGNDQVTLKGIDEKNPLKLALINGSKNVGMAVELEKRMMDRKIPGLMISLKATAKSNDYAKTLVIDQTGKYKEQVSQLAMLLNGEVATNSAEDRANADVMIIIGADFK